MWHIRTLAGVLVMVGLCIGAFAKADEPTKSFNIENQALASALIEFSRQADVLVVADPAVVNGHRAPAVRGTYSVADALNRLLVGARLVATRRPEGGFALAQAANPPELGAAREAAPSADVILLEEVVVTGTNIRGAAPQSAPVLKFSETGIRASGASTVAQFVANIPQNVATFTSRGIGGTVNKYEQRNSPNLRGLGDGTTLVLLNGRRIASPGGQTADLSVIPLSIVDRVDILLDGASTVYGGDAIGGVMNFVLKEKLEGAQTEVFAGSVGRGSYDQVGVSQSVGTAWSTGSILGSYSYLNQTPLAASDRDYAAAAAPSDLLPRDRRHSGFVAFRQNLGEKSKVFVDALYSRSRSRTAFARLEYADPELQSISVLNDDTQSATITAGVERKFLQSWRGEVAATYSFVDQKAPFDDYKFDGTPNFAPQYDDRNTDYVQLQVKADGQVVSLPAGALRASVGGSWSSDRFTRATGQAALAPKDDPFFGGLDRRRKTTEAYVEFLAPLVGESMNIPFVHSLEVNAAARYTEFSDLGSAVVPRVGLAWRPVEALTLRSSFSRSFRGVSLRSLGYGDAFSGAFIAGGGAFPSSDPFLSDPSTIVLQAETRAGDGVKPERSQTFTFGFDWRPLDGLALSASYYNIEFRERFGYADPTFGFAAFADPANFSELFTYDPSPEVVRGYLESVRNLFSLPPAPDTSDLDALANAVDVIMDLTPRNLARSEVEGLDFTGDLSRQISGYTLSSSLNLSYIIESSQKSRPQSTSLTVLNIATQTPRFRGRASVGLAYEPWSATASFNYVNSMVNVFAESPVPVDSDLTVDLTASYKFSDGGWLQGSEVSVSVLNLFDKDPPAVGQTNVINSGLNNPLGFDPVNGNPVGRYFQLRLRKTW